MTGRISIKIMIVLAVMTLAVLGAVACSSGVEPQDRQIDIEISDGKINLDPPLIQVNQGDTVTLNVGSDEHGAFHLHGYDIEKDVGPDEATPFEFTANATGRYNFSFHAGGEEHAHEDEGSDAHSALFESETLHGGDTFSYQIPRESHDEVIPYHNHMDHNMTGSITVTDDGGQTGTVEIEIGNDGSFSPAEVVVAPGATLVWTSKGDERQRVASGVAPGLDEQEDDEATDDDQAKEVVLGTLEVRPR